MANGSGDQADLVVVGAGLGGVSAALRAAEAGLSVILIEAAATIGGTAYYSGGGVHIWGAETWEAYRLTTPLSDPLLTRTLFNTFKPYVDWLTSTGAPGTYERTVIRGLGLLKYQLGRTMAPWARRRWFDHVMRRFGNLGGRVIIEARATRLIHNNGRVAAVVVRQGDAERTIAAGAVIVAAGGFQAAPDLLALHIGTPAEAFIQRSVPTVIGDGLRMATEAGAAPTPSMDTLYGHLMPAPPCRIDWSDPMAPITLSAFYAQHGIVVNCAGERFVDESTGELDGATINAAARQQPGLWIILDNALEHGVARYEVPVEMMRPSSLRYWRLLRHARFAWRALRPVLLLDSIGQAKRAGADIVRAPTIDALCREFDKRGANGAALRVTIDVYNAAIRVAAQPLPIPRTANRHAIINPPFLAIKVGVGVSMTYGGIAIDEAARALDANGVPVPGLYAVPGTAGGIHHLHYAGALAACGVFGMIAADAVVAEHAR